MTQFNQFGRPKSVAVTTPSLNITDITDLTLSPDLEIHLHRGGNTRFPRKTLGDDNTTISFSTTDTAALGLVKGMEVEGVTGTFGATVTGRSAALAPTQSAATLSLTVSVMFVEDVVDLTNQATGEPGSIQVKLRACVKEADGTEPTITADFSIAS